MIKSSGSSGNWTQTDEFKTPLDANDPIAPYITGWVLNLRKLPCQQWKSNPQPSRQLRSITIKASASAEMATVTLVRERRLT